jgi:hypothetical protein
MPSHVQLNVRIEPDVRDALRRAADADRRSMASLAAIVLEGWLRERGHLEAEPAPPRKSGDWRKSKVSVEDELI